MLLNMGESRLASRVRKWLMKRARYPILVFLSVLVVVAPVGGQPL